MLLLFRFAPVRSLHQPRMEGLTHKYENFALQNEVQQSRDCQTKYQQWWFQDDLLYQGELLISFLVGAGKPTRVALHVFIPHRWEFVASEGQVEGASSIGSCNVDHHAKSGSTASKKSHQPVKKWNINIITATFFSCDSASAQPWLFGTRGWRWLIHQTTIAVNPWSNLSRKPFS